MNKIIKKLIFIFLIIHLSGCSTGYKKTDILYKKLSAEDSKHLNYTGQYKVGSKYKVKNKTYTPKHTASFKQIGTASWYGPKFHGKKTANGEKYNKYCLTAAHKTLPMPSLVKVTNIKNNRSLIVMVNDRGPFSEKRIIDVSEKAASILGFKKSGTAKVKIEYLAKETNKFLNDINLKSNEGSKAIKKKGSKKCSVNCHVKLVNMRHKFPLTPQS